MEDFCPVSALVTENALWLTSSLLGMDLTVCLGVQKLDLNTSARGDDHSLAFVSDAQLGLGLSALHCQAPTRTVNSLVLTLLTKLSKELTLEPVKKDERN